MHGVSVGLEELVARLDAAVALGEPSAVAGQVKRVLQRLIQARTLRLSDEFRCPRPDGYARRLLYRAPDDAYTAVVMT